MNKIARPIGEIWRAWCQFWFDSRSDSQLIVLAIFRVFFYSVMFFFYFTRAFDVEFFYSDSGLLPSSYRTTLEFFRYHPTIFSGSESAFFLHAVHSLFLLFLFFSAIGFLTRFSTIAAFFLHLMFLNRNMSVMFGVDMIGTFYLLYMCFANCNAYLSVDAKLWPRRRSHSAVSHIAWRLMQIQLCVIYGFSGLEKLKGVRWWDGSALWDVLSMGNMQRWDLSFVAHAPVLLATGVYIVLFWEIYFPVLIWVRNLRNVMLLFGVGMHIGIFLFMNLPSFGAMMIALYILFLDPRDVSDTLNRVPLLKPRFT